MKTLYELTEKSKVQTYINAEKKARGPRGGVKHQPGRGHDSKSQSERKKQFARRQSRKRQAEDEDLKQRWAVWDRLTEDQRKLLPDLEPAEPRPVDDSDI
jgi:hypothetical protein